MNKSLLKIFFLVLAINTKVFASDSGSLRIEGITARGSGCTNGSVSSNVSPDFTSFSVLFDNYQAISNGNNQIDRKNCDLILSLSIEPGWSYAIVGADYRGFVNVEKGSYVSHQAIYSFDGSKPQNERPGFQNGKGYAFRNEIFNGPKIDNYTIHNDIDVRNAPWSDCSNSSRVNLYISTYLMARSVNNLAQTEANITLDSVDGSVSAQSFQLVWKKCSNNGHSTNPRDPQRPDDPRRSDPGRPPRYRR